MSESYIIMPEKYFPDFFGLPAPVTYAYVTRVEEIRRFTAKS